VKEVEPLDVDGNVNIMRSKGLGDTVNKFTKATGIEKFVNKISKGLNIPCGCEARKDAMNNMFPYNKKK